jgi:transposase
MWLFAHSRDCLDISFIDTARHGMKKLRIQQILEQFRLA